MKPKLATLDPSRIRFNTFLLTTIIYKYHQISTTSLNMQAFATAAKFWTQRATPSQATAGRWGFGSATCRTRLSLLLAKVDVAALCLAKLRACFCLVNRSWDSPLGPAFGQLCSYAYWHRVRPMFRKAWGTFTVIFKMDEMRQKCGRGNEFLIILEAFVFGKHLYVTTKTSIHVWQKYEAETI